MATGLSLGQFYGVDSIIEILAMFVSFQIAYYSNKIYKIIKERNYRFLSVGFLLIGISFIFQIIANLTILGRIRVEDLYFITHIFTDVGSSIGLVYFLSFGLYKLLYLAGFLFLFFMTTNIKNKENIFMYLYLGTVTIVFSIYFNSLFHITVILTLALIAMHFYGNYKKRRTFNTGLVFVAFLIMIIGHVFLLFSEDAPSLYIIGEFILLFGYSSLLLNQVKIKNEKKNKAGGFERHPRNSRKKKRS